MPERDRFRDRFQYWLDNTFSKGAIALIAWLGALSMVIILTAATILSIFQIRQEGADGNMTFAEAAWEAMMRTLDAGTMGGDSGWQFRLIMFIVTIGGVFVISSLIGVLSSGLENRLEHLRKGRSRAIEHDHTVILGWNDQIFTILDQISQANENHPGRCVLILGDEDKVVMEDTIREKVPQHQIPLRNRTRFVCRTGSPIEASDLAITNLTKARAVIVLSPREAEDCNQTDARTSASHQDAEVIKTVLAILHTVRNNASNQGQPLPFHIVAELRDPRNYSVAHVVANGEVEWILVGDLIARIIAQTCRQSGLSEVYNDLLDFKGNEIYISRVPELDGLTYAEALLRFEANMLIGIAPASGSVTLNPPMDTIIKAGDRLVLIAEDDDQIQSSVMDPSKVQNDCFSMGQTRHATPERTLVLGWNWRAATLIRELDNYVMPDSEVLVVAGQAEFETRVSEAIEMLELTNQSLTVREADTTDRTLLESLNLGRYHHVIVLSNLNDLTPQQSDAHTLITLLHLRDLADKNGWNFSITSEMLDVRNRSLADVTRADDFIVSDRLVSMILAQVSEQKELNQVYADLFDAQGAEVYLRPARYYVTIGQPVNFYTVVAAARMQGDTVLGYCGAKGVILNPAKSENVTFREGDKVVVLSDK